MISTDSLDTLDVQQLRHTVLELQARLRYATALNEKLTHEMAVLKRLKFAAKSEAFNAVQKSLLEETLDTDLAAGFPLMGTSRFPGLGPPDFPG